eukprot:3376687-Rhodomonas_salina.1
MTHALPKSKTPLTSILGEEIRRSSTWPHTLSLSPGNASQNQQLGSGIDTPSPLKSPADPCVRS